MAKKKHVITEIRETSYDHIQLLELPEDVEKLVFIRPDGGKIFCMYSELITMHNHRYSLYISDPKWQTSFLVNNMFSTFLELSLYAQLQHERTANN